MTTVAILEIARARRENRAEIRGKSCKRSWHVVRIAPGRGGTRSPTRLNEMNSILFGSAHRHAAARGNLQRWLTHVVFALRIGALSGALADHFAHAATTAESPLEAVAFASSALRVVVLAGTRLCVRRRRPRRDSIVAVRNDARPGEATK